MAGVASAEIKGGGGFASEALTVFVHVHTKEGGKS